MLGLKRQHRVRRTGSQNGYTGLVTQVIPENNSVQVAWWNEKLGDHDRANAQWLSIDEVEKMPRAKPHSWL